MKTLKNVTSLQKWIKVEKQNMSQVLLSDNKSISKTKVVIVRSNKPYTLL